jgi:phospholipase/carboxylesterase
LGLDRPRDAGVFLPAGIDPARPAPLVLALHGAGGVAGQMLELFTERAHARGFAVLAPESRGRTWDVIIGGYGPDVDFIDRALAWTFARQAVDPARIAIAGFSDGASYALSIGLTNGSLFSDVLAFSPGFMAPTQQADPPRVFVSHGTRDEVLPIDACSRRIAATLRRARVDLDYREFEGGHLVPQDMLAAALDRFLA